MAGWSILANGSALDCVDTVNKGQNNGGHVDVVHVTNDSVENFGEPKDRLRCLFDLVLSGYLEEVASLGLHRPMPPMVGNDGQSPDLLKLFLVVWEIGGFEFVSEKGLWAFVVKELGLDLGISALVKLIYAKYLNELEKWLRKSFEDRDGKSEGGGNFLFLSFEQEDEFRSLFANALDQKTVVNRVALMEYIKTDKNTNENEFKFSDASFRCMHNGVEKIFCDDDEKLYSRKRKRESLIGMLNWVIQVAKCPDDPSLQAISEPSKSKVYQGNEFWIQAIRAREALRHKRDDHSISVQPLLQNKQKMHPSMYEDRVLSRCSTEKIRCSERIHTPKSRSCSCCDSGSGLSKNSTCLSNTESGCGPKEQSCVTKDLSPFDITSDPCEDDTFRRYVAVGARFQAEVSEWTGIVTNSDSKWLGTREWPLNAGQQYSIAVTDPVGRGRQDSCICDIPGSVECIRFHIAEKRMKLKLELGALFYRWRFDRIGEEVSLRWTAEEENRFKRMVQLESPSLHAFWPSAFKFFPRKTKIDLVSYYFNVFLIRRRSYQNRVTPKSIDSDDDESEFGCISDSFGMNALKIPGLNVLKCSQNNQCIDWKQDECC